MVKLSPGRGMSVSCYLVCFFFNHILLGQVKADYLESEGVNHHGRCALSKTHVRPLYSGPGH